MEIFRVRVENKSAELVHGKLLPRPDFGDIKRVETELVGVCLLGLHDLHVRRPLEVLTGFDGVPEISLRVVGILATCLDGLFVGELFLSVLGQEMVLDVHEVAIFVHPLERVASVSVVEAPSLRCSMIAEEHETGVIRLRSVSKEVEEGIVVQQEIPRIAVLRANHIRTLERVTTEEDWLSRVSTPSRNLVMQINSQSSDPRCRSFLPWCRT
jgi:hypothetical protein